jgi:hypothetical protein
MTYQYNKNSRPTGAREISRGTTQINIQASDISLLTGNGVIRSPYLVYTFWGHARGWFSQAYCRRRLSASDLLSLADTCQLLVPVNAVLRWRELYYVSSEFQDGPVRVTINSEMLPACSQSPSQSLIPMLNSMRLP